MPEKAVELTKGLEPHSIQRAPTEAWALIS